VNFTRIERCAIPSRATLPRGEDFSIHARSDSIAVKGWRPQGPEYAAPLVAVCKELDLVWVWFYKEVTTTALEILARKEREGVNPARNKLYCENCIGSGC